MYIKIVNLLDTLFEIKMIYIIYTYKRCWKSKRKNEIILGFNITFKTINFHIFKQSNYI